jgi:ubiquitin carboxyl-terminal hydrolase 4/11/15
VGDLVNFPIEGLDIQPHVRMNCEEEGVSSVYDLYAVVNHYGSLNGGHYTAYAKNNDGNWYDFNDSCVSNHSQS